MFDKRLIRFFVLLLMVVLIFVFSFNFFIKPKKFTEFEIQKSLTTKDRKKSNQREKDLQSTTAHVIKNKYQKYRPLHQKNKELRNPFLWSRKVTKTKHKNVKKQYKPAVPNLGIISVSKNRKFATLNNVLVREGDKYGEHIVKLIKKNYIILSGDYGSVKLSVSNKLCGPVKVRYFD